MLLSVLAVFAGCAAHIEVPVNIDEPRRVQVLEHGRHTSLLLTAANSSRYRFAYGDWRWYVDGKQGIGSGARALLTASSAALGRQVIVAEQEGEALGRVLGVGIDQAHVLEVDGPKVDALLRSLEQIFEESERPPEFNEVRKMEFVPHPRAYTGAHNSNHQVAEWLRELGVKVSGSPASGNWRLLTPFGSGEE